MVLFVIFVRTLRLLYFKYESSNKTINTVDLFSLNSIRTNVYKIVLAYGSRGNIKIEVTVYV